MNYDHIIDNDPIPRDESPPPSDDEPSASAPNGGADILTAVRKEIEKFCVLPSEHALVAVTLWVAYTHLIMSFEFAPRLFVRSATKRSGKSRLLEIIAELVHRPLQTVNATVAYVFRSITEGDPPTLIFDEADTVFGPTKVKEANNEDLRALLNAGFRKGNNVGRTVGPMHVPTDFPVFAPAAIGGIGRLPDTVEDRAVIIHMKRRKATEPVTKFRITRDTPGLNDLRDKLASWAAEVKGQLDVPADMPVDDRAADVWEPLVSIADLAGGEWPILARKAARILSGENADDDADSETIQLLADVRTVFASLPGVTFLKSQALCEALRNLEESPWDEMQLTPTKLGQRLGSSTYHIKSRKRQGGSEGRARGYHEKDFEDAFARHLPPEEAAE